MKLKKLVLNSLILGLSAITAATSHADDATSPITGSEPIQITCTDTTWFGPSRFIHPNTSIAVDPTNGKIAWQMTAAQTYAVLTTGALGPKYPYENNAQVLVNQNADSIEISGSAHGVTRVPQSQAVHIVLEKTSMGSPGNPIYLLKNFQYQNWNYFDGPEGSAPVQQLADSSNQYCHFSMTQNNEADVMQLKSVFTPNFCGRNPNCCPWYPGCA